jgi:hypothetical protein
MRFRAALLCALTAVVTGAKAETATYTGSATSSVTKSILPLGNGGSVVTATSSGMAAISTNPPTLLEMNCAGLGLVSAESSHSTDFYCTFKANENDSLDVKGTDGPEGGQATVIGGSGRWQGATGSGTFKRVSSSDTSSSSTFELNVTTP